MAEAFSDALKTTLKEGETLVVGTITRVVATGDSDEPIIFFAPETNVSALHLEGHRINTGELVSTHQVRSSAGRVPRQFDAKRIAFDGKTPKVGGKVALVHLDRQR